MSERHDQRSRLVCQPEPGFFAVRLVRKGPRVPARILYERGLWRAEINGEVFAAASDPAAAPRLFGVWHSGDAITEAEYRHMLKVAAWARQHRPDHPAASPRTAIDLTRTSSIF